MHEQESQAIVKKQGKKSHNKVFLPILFLWFAPILLIILYDLATYLLRYYPSRHIPLPAPATITSLTLFGILASPLWVLAGFSFTYLFGSFGVTYLIRLFSHSTLLRRKLVIQPKEELQEIYSCKDHSSIATYLSPKSFSMTLGLVLA